jgi:hypothetical protein
MSDTVPLLHKGTVVYRMLTMYECKNVWTKQFIAGIFSVYEALIKFLIHVIVI